MEGALEQSQNREDRTVIIAKDIQVLRDDLARRIHALDPQVAVITAATYYEVMAILSHSESDHSLKKFLGMVIGHMAGDFPDAGGNVAITARQRIQPIPNVLISDLWLTDENRGKLEWFGVQPYNHDADDDGIDEVVRALLRNDPGYREALQKAVAFQHETGFRLSDFEVRYEGAVRNLARFLEEGENIEGMERTYVTIAMFGRLLDAVLQRVYKGVRIEQPRRDYFFGFYEGDGTETLTDPIPFPSRESVEHFDKAVMPGGPLAGLFSSKETEPGVVKYEFRNPPERIAHVLDVCEDQIKAALKRDDRDVCAINILENICPGITFGYCEERSPFRRAKTYAEVEQ